MGTSGHSAISRFTLDNGIRVVCEQIPHAYSVSIGIWVANGSRHESRELSGIAHFIEHMLFKGTERRTPLDIAREMDSVGGVLNAFTSREYVCYYSKVLHQYLPQAVDLLADIFHNSTLDSTEMEKERQVILQEIRMLDDTPDDLVHDLFSRNLWQGHPLGTSILGTEASVSSITREDALAYKQRCYRGDDIIISVAGKVEPVELVALLQPLFSGVAAGSGTGNTMRPSHSRRIEMIERDLEQVHLCVGTAALPQDHPDRYASFLLNTILGGGMSSRLFQEVREKEGLAYSIYSYISSYSDTGSLVIYAGSSSDRIAETADIVMRELRRLRNEPVSEEELDAARKQYKGNLLLSLESSDNRMTKLAKNEIYFGRNIPVEEIMRGFDAVTSDQLMRVSRQILNDASLTAILLGSFENSTLTPAAFTL